MSCANNEIGGDSFHVRDCYVWAEIFYLDSATDYREYLPHTPLARPRLIGDELTMLSEESPMRATGRRLVRWLKHGLLSLTVILFFAMLLSNC